MFPPKSNKKSENVVSVNHLIDTGLGQIDVFGLPNVT